MSPSFTLRKRSARSLLDELIHQCDRVLTHGRQPFRRLIQTVRNRSSILDFPLNRGWIDPPTFPRLVRAFGRMATQVFSWHQQPESWSAPQASSFVQYQTLVSHLFDRFHTPKFIRQIWLIDDLETQSQVWQLDLYLHLAAGRSVRRFPLLPCSLSKNAAAFFMQAPDDFSPCAALQWAWMRSLGADPKLARLLVGQDCLAVPSERNEFWESVIRFLLKYAPISSDETVAIVRFIDDQKYQPADLVWGQGAGRGPLQPEFTLQGRTLMSLRRHMANWRTEVQVTIRSLPEPLPSTWKPTGIHSFRYWDGEQCWTIDELLSARELAIEGNIMEHCVATYTSTCARRKTTIWSMKSMTPGIPTTTGGSSERSVNESVPATQEQDGFGTESPTRRRVLTIEVCPESKSVRQAKGKRNAPPTDKALQVLIRWVNQEGLLLEPVTEGANPVVAEY